MPRLLAAAGALAAALLLPSCSLNRLAVRAVTGVLAGGSGGSAFTTDDDPELVRDALPFAMKTFESLLQADPGNADLALAAGRAFASYAFAFVQAPADGLPASAWEVQRAERLRAKKLFLRARDYFLQGLEARRPGFRAAFEGREGPAAALALARAADADWLYWAGAAALGAFSCDPFDFSLVVTIPRALALLRQVDAWDPSWGSGAVAEILTSFYGAAPADLGGGEARARESFARAVALSRGARAGPYVALATAVSVKRQDRAEFRALLEAALAVDLDASPGDRLVNVVNQRRARALLASIDDLFIAGEGGEDQ